MKELSITVNDTESGTELTIAYEDKEVENDENEEEIENDENEENESE